MFTKKLALFLFPALAVAQYGAPPGPATSASSSTPASTSSAASVAPTAPANTPGQINIDVAFNRTLVFNPSSITAPVGTLVTFYFPNFGTNHSVTQSSFENPCTYLNASTNSSAGFDSDLISESTFTLNITEDIPVWFFCKQPANGGHCSKGMVGSINAPTTGNTFAEFQAKALAIGSEPQNPQNGPVVAGVGATATGPPVPDGTSSGSSSSSSGAMKVTASFGFALFSAVLAVAMA